jgi:hypothetical protein
MTPDAINAVKDECRIQLRIPAVIKSRIGSSQSVPICSGLCLPKSQLFKATEACVEGFADKIIAQVDILNRWCDGSIKWMLASFLAPQTSTGEQALEIRVPAEPSRPTAHRTTVLLQSDSFKITTSNPDAELPESRTVTIRPMLQSRSGHSLSVHCDKLHQELTGSVRQVIVVDAVVPSHPLISLQFRVTFWMATGLLQIDTRIRNSQRARHAGGLWDLGDPGSFCFRSLDLAVSCQEVSDRSVIQWKAERTTALRTTTDNLRILQYGSGSRFWSSPNHQGANGVSMAVSRGYEVTNHAGTLSGHRAEPVVLLQGDESFLIGAYPESWQQFPSGVAAEEGTLRFELFPEIAGIVHELQGGEQKTQAVWIRSGAGQADLNQMDWVFDPPRMLQSPNSIEASGAFPWFAGPITAIHPDPDADLRPETTVHQRLINRFTSYLTSATTGSLSFEERRASIDEYGWRNFGDLPADHEQTFYRGSNTVISHYNNQFDSVFGGILQLAATSDLKWFDLLDPLARHVIDIDIYHTTQDRAAFNGGLFWHTDHYVDACSATHRTYSGFNKPEGRPYGGGPSCEHNYTTGLMYYYFLTGSPQTRDAVLKLADWVIRMDDGTADPLGLLDDGPTGRATATVSEDYHGPGRGAGNSINALLDGWTLTSEERYLRKADELIRRCVHPDQDIDQLKLNDAEHRWSYTVFLNSLGKYLLLKRDAGRFDGMYSFVRDVLQTYGHWMAIHEHRTLDNPESLEYPTEAWAAQDLRKANVMRIAAGCGLNDELAATLRTRADEISDAAWQDFESFGKAALTTRCLALVLTEGHREIFHRAKAAEHIPDCTAKYFVQPWSMFVPQKQRVRRMFTCPTGLLKAAFSVFRPRRVFAAIQAVLKQL